MNMLGGKMEIVSVQELESFLRKIRRQDPQYSALELDYWGEQDVPSYLSGSAEVDLEHGELERNTGGDKVFKVG